MKILLTGANGFIGEYLYEALKANGHEVQTVTRNSEPKFGNKNIACDLEQKSNLDHIIGENEVVVHLAGRAHVMSDTGANKAEAYKSANTDVTRKLAESAHRKGVRRFVFLSSVKVTVRLHLMTLRALKTITEYQNCVPRMPCEAYVPTHQWIM
jgi:nucleoside-diphosphate-sugar epimerase